jgi:hypothetical protein
VLRGRGAKRVRHTGVLPRSFRPDDAQSILGHPHNAAQAQGPTFTCIQKDIVQQPFVYSKACTCSRNWWGPAISSGQQQCFSRSVG